MQKKHHAEPDCNTPFTAMGHFHIVSEWPVADCPILEHVA